MKTMEEKSSQNEVKSPNLAELRDMSVSFYKEDGMWYADMPNHTKEENEMVLGSDDYLESLSNGSRRVTVFFSTKEPKEWLEHFTMVSHTEEDGAFYHTENLGADIYLCNVAHDIFVEHPMEFWVVDFVNE